MINVNDNFKIDIRTYGRQFDVKLKANNTDISSDYLNYLKPSFNTSLFKTVMHQIEIDSKLYMPADTKITGKIGVKVNEKTYNYINLNNYYVKSCERQEDTNSYRILAYTKMKESMIDYDLTLTEKITVRNYLIKICQRLGWNTNNIPATFINSEKLVDPSLHTGINYSFRDALDELATITCSFLMFKGDEFYLLYLTETNESIDETYLDEDNITIGEKYIINSLVFSRAEESDNIFRKDDTSIATNGLYEYRISDCQLLSTNDRSDYIDEMFNYLKTLSFYIFDVQSKGILFLEACDIFNFVLNEVTYKTILLNNEIELDDGLTEKLYTDEPEETETEYKYADSTDKKINQAYMLVDKQNKKIIQKVSSVEQSIENITNTEGEATGKNIHLEDSSDEPLVSVKVKGETNQATRSGKNLLKLNDTQTVNGVTATNNDDGTITLNGTSTRDFFLYVANGTRYSTTIKNFDAGQILTQSVNVISGTSSPIPSLNTIALEGTNTKFNFFANNVTKTLQNDIGLNPTYLDVKIGTTFNNWTIFPQLEIGESVTTPEQYGASPSLDCSSPIENVEGRNKFNINGELTDLSGGNFLTKIEGNKIIIPNIESNGSSALFDYIEVKENTDINISFNLLQGTARIGLRLYDKNKNIINNSTISLPKFTYNQYYQGYWHNGSNVSTTIPEGVKYIRYLTIGVQGTKKNIYEKFQIEKGNSKKPYAPYNSLEIKDVGENLLNVTAKTTTVQGLTFTVNEDKSITINGTNTGTGTAFFRLADNFVLPAGDYTLSNKNANANYGNFVFYDDNYNFVTKNISNATFTKDTTIKPYIRVKAGATVNNQTIYPMILKGAYTEETMPAYKPYQEQKETFPLGNQKLMKGSYLVSGGIHHNRKQYVFTGEENIQSVGAVNNVYRYNFDISDMELGFNKAICSHFKQTEEQSFAVINEVCINTHPEQHMLVFFTNFATLNEFKAYLSEQYSNGTPVIVEYELAEPETVPYTAEQQEAWDKIEQLHTYKNVTNIFSDAELDIVYARDNGLSDMYETKQNAERNYTKTTEKLVEQKMTTDNIQQNVSKTETVVANNYKELKTKFDDYAPKSDVVTLQNSVEKIQTDTYTKTEINTKLIDGSVEKVSTTAGTFDENGLTIEKTNAKTKGNFNEKGMSVIDNTGSKGETLLFAGYDEELNETIVKSKNMTVEKYLVVGANSRFENYNNTTLNATGTGVFII